MAESQLEESEDLDTRPEESVPQVRWETHSVAGKQGLEADALMADVTSGKKNEAQDIQEKIQLRDDESGGIKVNVEECEYRGALSSSEATGTTGIPGYAICDCEGVSEDEVDGGEVFMTDVGGVALENPAVFHATFLPPDVESPTESPPQNLNYSSGRLLRENTDTTTTEVDTVSSVTATGVADDTSQTVKVTTSVELTSVSNQNSEPNQNIYVSSRFVELTSDGAKNERVESKNEDELNRNFDARERHRHSRTTDDLPPNGKSKHRHVGHLVLDELTPTASRRSYRSKRKHLNSSGKHGDSRKRGDDRTIVGDEQAESSHSATERKRQSIALGSVTEDASLFVPPVGDWHEVNSEGEGHDAVGRKSSYLRAVKVSASQIDAKVHRSTSYRIATARHQVATGGEADQPPNTVEEGDTKPDASATEMSDPLTRSSRSDRTSVSYTATKETTEASHSDEGARKGRSSDRRGSSHHTDHGRRLSLAKELLLLSPTAVSAAQSWSEAVAVALAGASDLATTPTKSSGIRRLRDLFTEKSSPKDVDHQHFVFEDRPETSSSSGVVDGQLNCKNTMMDGKRSTDRAWKCVHAVLRGHHLYLHPDKTTQNVLVYENSISVRNALVDIAYDYVKRKNVFRLTTYNISEFLLEASDQESMLHWIRSIQECGYLIGEKEFSASRELIRQKRLMSRQTSRSGAHDSSHRKHSDPSRSPRLASKIPEPVSVPRTRKASREPSKSPQRENPVTDEDTPKSPQRKSTAVVLRHADNSEQKSKDTRTWKSKMVKKFKQRLSSQSPATHNVEQTGAFGLELEKCIPSPNNEFVPLIVDACITIVESKGLTNKGIYRVPGNSAAITQLQAELNKDPTSINLESEKWQDVNAVISLLKLFFRELPDPLITKELYPSMIEANRVDDATKRMLKMKRLLHHLPMHNFETFRFLASHLNKVSSAGDINKMDARNLAIVFGPTLMQPKQDMLNMVKDMSDQCRIVESIILHFDWFFSSWDEDVNVPADGEKDSSMVPITGMDRQLIEKAEHMVLEEQTQGSKKPWRPNPTNRKMNPRERGTGSVGGVLDSTAERNINEEIMIRSGSVVGEKVPAVNSDGKGAKTRAKSVPPRPVSTLHVQPGKPVERMTETAPAKRKNSSPVTFQRRESAIPGGTAAPGRHQFHRSSSEASEKTYRVSLVNTKAKQFGGTKANLFEQNASNRERKSISSHALFNAKLAQSHKLSPGSTPRGSEEKLGSPHSSRGSRNTLAGDLGDAKRKKVSQHHMSGRGAHPKSSAGSKKLDVPSRKVGTRQSDFAQSKEDKTPKTEDETPKTEDCKDLEITKTDDWGLGGDKSEDAIGVCIVEEPCLVLRQADSRRVWNTMNQKWEDLPRSRGRSPVENNQTSDVSSTRLNDEDTGLDRSVAEISNPDRVNFLAEKSNVSPRLGSRDKMEDVLEITEHQVVCEDKENHIEVIYSDNTDGSIIRLSPVCHSHHDTSGGSPGKTSRSLSPDATLPSPGSIPSSSSTTRVVLRRNNPDFARSEQRGGEPCSRPRTDSLLVSPDTEHLTPGGGSGVVDDDSTTTSKALHRTSSEPNLRVSSPVVLRLKGSPKREARPKQPGRSFSTTARSHGTSGHHSNTLPAKTRLRGGRNLKDSSRSLTTYESSV